MLRNSKFSRIAVAVALSVGLSTVAMAQETSSEIAGKILGPQGNPAAGTVVKVTHVPTGTTKTVTVNAVGSFNVKGLRVGGPYTIEVDSDVFADKYVSDVYLSLGESTSVDLSLEADNIERIAITASQVSSMAFGKSSPAANFSLEDLQTAPSINRDINDIVRIDPRIYVDEGGTNGIQCAGKNPRFNSLTVDGVRQNDLFGLNSNGYPTERMPFSFDAIQDVAVEFAPFDVQYGSFTACNINAVTKSGSNEIFGSVFYDYTSDSMRGDSLEGDKIQLGDYDETRYGFTIGAPLIKDTLFIFAAYEKLDGANLEDRGPIGSGAASPVDVTLAEINEIAQIARDLYQYDPGPLSSSIPNEDEKLLVKLDWNINDDHRFALTYNWNDGNNFQGSDRDANEIEFLNHYYERGAELESLVGALYSDWTDKFSTEIRIISQELDNRQVSFENQTGQIGGMNFGEMQVLLEGREGLDDVTVYLGGDDSRQANDLDWEQFGLILRGKYYMDSGHTLTFGYEMDDLDVFNVFVQHTETEIRFEGIDNFRDGLANAIYYNNAPSGDPRDAAAVWGYQSHALYLQDEFNLTDDLTITAGLRYEWYTSDDKPIENPEFTADYGFSNATNLDGADLIQPRIGFNYYVNDSTEVRGGVGLYSGGNPNVWLSNNFSNNNILQFGARGRSYCYTPDFARRAVIDCPSGQRSLFDNDIVWRAVEDGVPAGPGYGIPSEVYDQIAGGQGGNFDLNYLDPNFEIPSEWKVALGMTHQTDDDYIFQADIIFSRTEDAIMVKGGHLVADGVTSEGYIDYDDLDRMTSLVLTNSSVASESFSVSGSVTKEWDNGIAMTAGYAYNDSEDVQPMTSAVAFSSFQERAFTNPNEEVSSLSDYNIKHRLTVDLRYTAEFFDGLETRFSAFGLAQSGRPYSLTLSRNDGNGVFGFTPFIDTNNVLPMGNVRNGEASPWWAKIDIAVYQDIPAFNKEHDANLYFVMDNFTNFLNDDWGILEEPPFNRVQVGTNNPTPRVGDASLWELRVGVNYRF